MAARFMDYKNLRGKTKKETFLGPHTGGTTLGASQYAMALK